MPAAWSQPCSALAPPCCWRCHTHPMSCAGLATFSVQDVAANNEITVLAIGPADGHAVDEVIGHLKLL